MQFWGIDSGVRHSVGGSDYGTVRCATFMARAVLRSELKARAQKAAAAAANGAGASPLGLPASVTELDHLVTLSPSLFAEIAACLPAAITGKDFLARYGGHGDNATAVDPATTYDPRGCASHPVHEHARVSAFRLLLLASLPSAEAEEARLVALGELMYQSHASYTAIGLVRRDRGARPCSLAQAGIRPIWGEDHRRRFGRHRLRPRREERARGGELRQGRRRVQGLLGPHAARIRRLIARCHRIRPHRVPPDKGRGTARGGARQAAQAASRPLID